MQEPAGQAEEMPVAHTTNVFLFGERVARAHSSRRMVQAHSSDEHVHFRRRCYCGAGDREDKGQSDWTGEDVYTESE
jgi:hypothetical protein